MTPEEYEARKQAKIERYEDRARDAQSNANALHDRARQMADVIPFGQPILIGHHSEKRDRAYRGRIENTFRKAFEEQDKAAYYARRAEAAASNRAIFSDDPSAAEKLSDKIARLEKQQELMRAANKAIRKGDDEALRDLGFDDARITLLKQPDFCGRIGFADYQLTNNSANIRRLKQRLERVSEAQAAPEITLEGANARFEDCPPENRVRLFYPGKPSEEIRSRLKSNGFRWSPTNGAWQAFRNCRTIEIAKKEAGIEAAETFPPTGENVAALDPGFVERINFLAAQCGKTNVQVYALWKKYAEDCRISDQSAVLPEFEDWYKKDLAPVVPAGFVSDEAYSQ